MKMPGGAPKKSKTLLEKQLVPPRNHELVQQESQRQEEVEPELTKVEREQLNIVREWIVDSSPEEITQKLFRGLPYSGEFLNHLSQEEVDTMVHKAIEFCTEHSADAHHVGFNLARGGKISRDSFTSKAYRALYAAMKDPHFSKDRRAVWAMQQMDDAIGQNGQLIDPNVLIEEVADIYWRNDVHPSLRTSGVASLNYIFSFHWGPRYEAAILRSLDFNNPQNYSQTGHFLELLRHLHREGSHWSFSEEAVPRAISSSLRRAVEHREGSYLLNMRARQLYDRMEKHDTLPDNDGEPFEVSNGVLGFHKSDGLYIIEGETRGKVEGLLFRLRELRGQLQPPQELVDAAIAQGEHEIIWTPNRQLWDQYQETQTAIAALFTYKVDARDLVLQTKDGEMDLEQAKIAEHDFEYMLTRPVRKTIENEFGCTLADLTLHEQFRMLQYLKTVSVQDAESTKEFTHSFGVDGLRTFLVTEQDPTLRDKVFEFAHTTAPEQAHAVFAAYSSLIESVDTMGTYLPSRLVRRTQASWVR